MKIFNDITVDEADVRRFMRHVRINRECQDCCWEWQSATTADGHGKFQIGGKKVYAHRFAAAVTGAEILPGCLILHKCFNPRCVNPNHLKPGTHAENMRDMVESGGARRAVDQKIKMYGTACAKVSRDVAANVLKMRESGMSLSTIKILTRMDHRTIRKVLNEAGVK